MTTPLLCIQEKSTWAGVALSRLDILARTGSRGPPGIFVIGLVLEKFGSGSQRKGRRGLT
jgi:hypothetical protein